MTTNIEFNFDVKKTVQVAGAFLRFHDDSMICLRLLSLLYIADRKALEKINQPLTGDIYISNKYGPTPGRIFGFVRGKKSIGVHLWNKYISTRFDSQIIEACPIRLIKYPGHDELSEREEEIIKEVYYQFKDMNANQVAKETRSFKEYKTPLDKSLPINNVDILKYIGKNDEEIEYIKEVTKRESSLNKMSILEMISKGSLSSESSSNI